VINWLLGQIRGTVLFFRANAVYRSGNFDRAAVMYQEVLQYQPDRAVAHFNLGLALYKGGERRSARKEWEQALELSDGTNAYLHEQAKIMLRQFS
jgi:Flp pilus assembly protein TadD